MNNIEQLQKELNELSQRIYCLKQLIEDNSYKNSLELKRLKNKLKNLQWQALFYIEKIENLK